MAQVCDAPVTLVPFDAQPHLERLAKLVVGARIQKGLTQRDLALSVGVATITIRKLEEQHHLPHTRTLFHIFYVLDISFDEIYVPDPTDPRVKLSVFLYTQPREVAERFYGLVPLYHPERKRCMPPRKKVAQTSCNP